MAGKLFDLKLSQKGLILVLVPLLFELIFILALSTMLARANAAAARAERSRAVMTKANSLSVEFYQAGVSLLGYGMSGSSPLFAKRFQRIADQIPKDLADYKALLGNEKQSEAVRRFWILGQQAQKLLLEIKQDFDEPGSFDILSTRHPQSVLLPMINQLMAQLDATTSEYKKVEAHDLRAKSQSQMTVYTWLVIGFVFNIGIAVWLASYFNKSTNSRLSILTDNTKRLAAGKELNPLLQGEDEIAMVDRSFHDMATARQELERRKQEFVAMLSHDLRSPLTSIQMLLIGIKQGIYPNTPEMLIKRAAGSEESITRVIGLINTLLDIEKLESGQMTFEFSSVNLEDLVKQAVNALEESALQKQIEITTQCESLDFSADSEKLIRVMVNLISNAIKFSPEKGRITITGERKNNDVEMSVQDEGPGIPQEYRSMIFDRFKQVPEDGGAPKSGTGLGLAICAAIVQGHNGAIGVESDGRNGSKFWFRIPVKQS